MWENKGADVRRRRGRAALLLIIGMLWQSLARADQTLAVSGIDELGDQDLIKTVLAYYQAEQTHDWQTTYALRGARFARVVPYATYARQMEIDALGWDLLGIDGRSMAVDGSLTTVTISFREGLTPEVAARLLGPGLATPLRGTAPQRYAQAELTQWEVEDGQWIALAPGARRHFVLNERMVWD